MINYKEFVKFNSVCAHCETSVQSTLTNVTLSLNEGLEEVENTLVLICDICGNMTAIPSRSLPPIRLAHKKIVESGKVSKGAITTELKSIVDARKSARQDTKRNNPQEYPLAAATS